MSVGGNTCFANYSKINMLKNMSVRGNTLFKNKYVNKYE